MFQTTEQRLIIVCIPRLKKDNSRNNGQDKVIASGHKCVTRRWIVLTFRRIERIESSLVLAVLLERKF